MQTKVNLKDPVIYSQHSLPQKNPRDWHIKLQTSCKSGNYEHTRTAIHQPQNHFKLIKNLNKRNFSTRYNNDVLFSLRMKKDLFEILFILQNGLG